MNYRNMNYDVNGVSRRLLSAPRTRLAFVLGLVAVTLGVATSGCSWRTDGDPYTGMAYVDLRSPDPVIRMRAANIRGKLRDYNAVPALIENLRDDEKSNRLWAHIALLQIYHGPGHETYPRPFGYHWGAEIKDRNMAIRLWEDWWEKTGRQLAADQSAPPKEDESRIEDVPEPPRGA